MTMADESHSKLLEELFSRAREDILGRGASAGEWRMLGDDEIAKLEEGGSSSSDWSMVLVSPGSDLRSARGCRFTGDVRLDLTPWHDGRERFEPLLLDSNIEDSEIGPGCRVLSCRQLRGVTLEEGVRLEDCGRITYSRGSVCGSGEDLRLGVETGERNVPSFPMLDLELATSLSGGEGRGERLGSYSDMLREFLDDLRKRERGLLRRGCRIASTPVVEDCFIGPGVSVDNATALRNSTLLGSLDVKGGSWSAKAGDGALVRNSIMQWGASADSMAIVDGSVMGEASVVEKQGKLESSFLGPNSVLGEGEVTASLVGPFTSSHHQSLLIAARWPEGKGNIGYGANVGSNHTSRLPDQEIRPGEGMFFGLACSVKFPADYSRAPYTIIATGVTTLPQRVEFPFSLICAPFESRRDVPPAFNQIIPAWVLSDNMFSVRRNDSKFRDRNRARFWRPVPLPAVREETVQLMLQAMERLRAAGTKDLYTEADVPGLGKNFMTEEHRLRALETYRLHIRLFALEEHVKGSPCELAVSILRDHPPGSGGNDAAGELDVLRGAVEEAVRESRVKDRVRGTRIISDYSDVRE